MVAFVVCSGFDAVSADSHVAPPTSAVLRCVEEQQHASLAPATPHSRPVEAGRVEHGQRQRETDSVVRCPCLDGCVAALRWRVCESYWHLCDDLVEDPIVGGARDVAMDDLTAR